MGVCYGIPHRLVYKKNWLRNLLVVRFSSIFLSFYVYDSQMFVKEKHKKSYCLAFVYLNITGIDIRINKCRMEIETDFCLSSDRSSGNGKYKIKWNFQLTLI